MTLQQLKYVIAIADSGSVNSAAKNLYLSQPSLSSAVRELEEEIGFELFRRSNRGVTITAEGEEFLNYARQVCQQYTLLEDRFVAEILRLHPTLHLRHQCLCGDGAQGGDGGV